MPVMLQAPRPRRLRPPRIVHAPVGPSALIANRCLCALERQRWALALGSVHPGHSVAEVVEHAGFEFDRPPHVPVTPAPSIEALSMLRTAVAAQLAEVYPQFAAQVFGVGNTA